MKDNITELLKLKNIYYFDKIVFIAYVLFASRITANIKINSILGYLIRSMHALICRFISKKYNHERRNEIIN